MLNYNDDPTGKLIYDLQELGLMTNELKSIGENTVPIDAYENLLEACITICNNYRDLEDDYSSFIKNVREALKTPLHK